MAEMEYGKIEGIEKPLSRLAQGTMVLSSEKMDWSLELMDQIYEQGCNTFDCAYIYSGGKSDLAFGEWLHTRGVRDKVVVIEKGCHHDQSGSRVNPEALKNDLETSLDRLKTDHVEIYLLHRDDPSVPVDEIVDALNEHVRKGQIKIFGGSNWRPERLEAANAYALTKGLQPFRVSSPNFSLAEMVQSPWGGDCVSISGPQNKKDREWYSRQRMPLFTWSSLARGFFSGKISRDNLDALKGADQSSIRAYCHEVNFQRLDRVTELAKEKGLTVPQIALAYVVNQRPTLDIYALIGCYTADEFRQAIAASALKLTENEMAWLDLRRDRPE